MSRAAAQPDLFAQPERDLFAGLPEPVREPETYVPSRAWVRAYLETVLAEARAVEPAA